MELGFPRPRPRPRPAGRRGLHSSGGVEGYGGGGGGAAGSEGWQWGKGYLGVDPDPHQALGPCLSFPRQWLRLIS